MNDAAPLILTATLDPAAQARFDALRSAHFPSHRLIVGAHLTLFHALPSDTPIDALGREAAASPPLPVQVTGVRLLGNGVAFALQSEPLHRMRERFRRKWLNRLTPQDSQPWRPHMTIQNKVDPGTARALHDVLAAGFVPYSATANGLALWRYRDGPWQAAGWYAFGG